MKRINIITGHYGSGKSEISVSLAMNLNKKMDNIYIADLDIVNPYFRSRERAEMLNKNGIGIISSSLGHNVSLNLPALSAEVRKPLYDPKATLILDVGGDPVGAKALKVYHEDLVNQDYDMFLVVNAYRPETADLKSVLKYIDSIEYASGLKINALISNTHLLRDTRQEDIEVGYKLVKEVSEYTKLPIRYICGIKSSIKGFRVDSGEELLEIGMYMRDEWM